MARAATKLDIDTYNAKRDFAKTKEPKGRTAKARGDSFVVQKHDASRLHWDFRLELDGVLKSWAVPKGPSLDPGQNRLAMRTEDHPLDYGDFEGTIPAGEYGGGTGMMGDQGRGVPRPRQGPPPPPARLWRFRRDEPGRRIWRRHGDDVGPGAVDPRSPQGPAQDDRGRAPPFHARGRGEERRWGEGRP